MSMTAVVILIVGVVVAATVAWYFVQQRRSRTLRTRFGPEYDHAIREFGNQRRAEEALLARQKRRESIRIRALKPDERERFAADWHDVQARFVDDPPGSIREADHLVTDAMLARGYPMADFDQRIEDLSVDHPHVVRNYRAAHAIELRRAKGEASTEDLRKALVYFRDLFDELLGAPVMSSSREGTR
jgi:hypothetical protein